MITHIKHRIVCCNRPSLNAPKTFRLTHSIFCVCNILDLVRKCSRCVFRLVGHLSMSVQPNFINFLRQNNFQKKKINKNYTQNIRRCRATMIFVALWYARNNCACNETFVNDVSLTCWHLTPFFRICPTNHHLYRGAIFLHLNLKFIFCFCDLIFFSFLLFGSLRFCRRLKLLSLTFSDQAPPTAARPVYNCELKNSILCI